MSAPRAPLRIGATNYHHREPAAAVFTGAPTAAVDAERMSRICHLLVVKTPSWAHHNVSIVARPIPRGIRVRPGTGRRAPETPGASMGFDQHIRSGRLH